MRQLIAVLLMLLPAPALAGQITSAYTEYDLANGCRTVDAAAEGEGDWKSLVCPGHQAYEVHVVEDDLRQSISYGPNVNEPAWESFGALNHADPKIEWLLDDGIPFATIQRWAVAAEQGKPEVQVLVVETVGQKASPGGCAAALVLANGKPDANDVARKIADQHARTFRCGESQAERVGSPLPDFGREMR